MHGGPMYWRAMNGRAASWRAMDSARRSRSGRAMNASRRAMDASGRAMHASGRAMHAARRTVHAAAMAASMAGGASAAAGAHESERVVACLHGGARFAIHLDGLRLRCAEPDERQRNQDVPQLIGPVHERPPDPRRRTVRPPSEVFRAPRKIRAARLGSRTIGEKNEIFNIARWLGASPGSGRDPTEKCSVAAVMPTFPRA